MKKLLWSLTVWSLRQVVDVYCALKSALLTCLFIVFVCAAVVVFLNYVAVFLIRWSI